MLHITNENFYLFCEWLEREKGYGVKPNVISRVVEKPHHYKELYKEFLEKR